ncbi:MAG: hypothetical protein AAGH15_23405 [Myxococcota bacterium]
MRAPRLERVAGAVLAVLVLATPVAAQEAPAEEEPFYVDDVFEGRRPPYLAFHAGISHFGPGLAAGGRFGIPLVDNGFITTLNNSVHLSVGADLYYARFNDPVTGDEAGFGLGIPVALHWEFYLPKHWSAYAELGFNVYLSPAFFDGQDTIEAGAWILAAVGAVWRFAPKVGLEMRLGNPYSAVGLRIDL